MRKPVTDTKQIDLYVYTNTYIDIHIYKYIHMYTYMLYNIYIYIYMSEYASIIHVNSLMDTPHMLLCSGSFHESWSLIRTTEVVRPRSIPNTQKYTSLSIYNICNQSTSISPSGATGSFPACQVILSSTRMNRWPAVTKAHSMGLPSSHHRPQIVRIKHTHTHT